jgi:hypothetical protein
MTGGDHHWECSEERCVFRRLLVSSSGSGGDRQSCGRLQAAAQEQMEVQHIGQLLPGEKGICDACPPRPVTAHEVQAAVDAKSKRDFGGKCSIIKTSACHSRNVTEAREANEYSGGDKIVELCQRPQEHLL